MFRLAGRLADESRLLNHNCFFCLHYKRAVGTRKDRQGWEIGAGEFDVVMVDDLES